MQTDTNSTPTVATRSSCMRLGLTLLWWGALALLGGCAVNPVPTPSSAGSGGSFEGADDATGTSSGGSTSGSASSGGTSSGGTSSGGTSSSGASSGGTFADAGSASGGEFADAVSSSGGASDAGGSSGSASDGGGPLYDDAGQDTADDDGTNVGGDGNGAGDAKGEDDAGSDAAGMDDAADAGQPDGATGAPATPCEASKALGCVKAWAITCHPAAGSWNGGPCGSQFSALGKCVMGATKCSDCGTEVESFRKCAWSGAQCGALGGCGGGGGSGGQQSCGCQVTCNKGNLWANCDNTKCECKLDNVVVATFPPATNMCQMAQEMATKQCVEAIAAPPKDVCQSNQDCASTEVCAKPDCKSAGTCAPKASCVTGGPNVPAVCGCDGKTFTKGECAAVWVEGVGIKSKGTCP